MTIERIEATPLWQHTLQPREGDSESKYRDRLRSAYFSMRENVKHFVTQIHQDVLGLTVHDETHLDALWDTASKIAGDQFALTPIESFVFGAAVLLHDTGMAIATYPGGIKELEGTLIWKDTKAGIIAQSPDRSSDQLDEREERILLFSVLRKLHAQQAENLIKFTFKRPRHEEAIPLLEDTGLRDALGEAIGRIAHSHHWDSADLTRQLVPIAGAVPGFPSDWTLNEVKVACLVRCADAAHIDSLRAPTMLFASSNIQGHSLEHWAFQNKLNQVVLSKDKLVYYAGQSFKVDEASSWWLAFDTMLMIDREIKSCNAILDDIGVSQFEAHGVQGVESPQMMSKTVRVEGWAPISAEVKVSDPVHLARTIGGKNLYGSDSLAPVRELLQNAVDAVRARRAHEQRPNEWGKVRIIIEQPSTECADVWLHVDDNGTGMSERVLTGPLIDFGKSFWSSSMIDDEFPGLRSKAPQLVGKFGIGFFSVFLLGNAVRVATRKFDASEDSAMLLSFDELTRRPLIRRAATGELPLDFSTRVSVKLSELSFSHLTRQDSGVYGEDHVVSFVDAVAHLVATVDVDIDIIDRVNSSTREHSGSWSLGPSKKFFEDVTSLSNPNKREQFIDDYHDRLRLIKEDDGSIVGRAALVLPNASREWRLIVSVGGFSTRQRYSGSVRSSGAFVHFEGGYRFVDNGTMVGAIIGRTDDASRSRAMPLVTPSAISRWAQEQDKLVRGDEFTTLERVSICHSLMSLGAESRHLEFGFLGGRFVTIDHFKGAILGAKFIDIPLSYSEFRNGLKFKNMEDLTTEYFTSHLHPTVAVISTGEMLDILSEEERRSIVESGLARLSATQVDEVFANFTRKVILTLASEIWGNDPICSVERVSLIGENAVAGQLASWVLRISRDDMVVVDTG